MIKSQGEFLRCSVESECSKCVACLTRFIICYEVYVFFAQFMAWERNFEARVLKIREKELRFQRRNYIIEVIFLPLSFEIDHMNNTSARNARWYSMLSGKYGTMGDPS
jgi:hypothetical protein